MDNFFLIHHLTVNIVFNIVINSSNFCITFNSFSVKKQHNQSCCFNILFFSNGFHNNLSSASIYKPIHNLEILSQAKFLKYVDSMTDLYNKGVRPET